MPIILLGILFVFSVIGYNMAKSRGREPLLWAILCFLTGLIGVIILAAIGNATPGTAAAVSATGGTYDRKNWSNLVEVDPDIAQAVASVRPYGQFYVDVLADKYLSLNDKSYLPSLVSKVIQDAEALTLVPDSGTVQGITYKKIQTAPAQ